MKIISSRAVISKKEYKEKYEKRVDIFSDKEINHLKERTALTAAGFVALKGAIKNFALVTSNIEIEDKDIELSHSDDGAPIITNAPREINIEKLKVSISHSKDDIVGLVSGEIEK